MKKRVKIIILLLLIIIISFIVFKLWVKSNVEKEQVTVLMYHEVMKDEDFIEKPDTIRLSTFEKQLKYFKDNNYKTLTMDEFYCWKQGCCNYNEKSVVLTFDDGFYSFHHLVTPLLEKYDMHATNFVIGSVTGDVTKEYDVNKYGTIGKDIIHNHSKNVNYQSHSFDMHRYVNNKQRVYSMNKKELQDDIDNMKNIGKFNYISYPFNTDTDLAIETLKENDYKLAFRGEGEKAVKSCNDYQVSRIGVKEDFNHFKSIFETKKYNNRYGNGLLRKIFITIERKLNIRLG